MLTNEEKEHIRRSWKLVVPIAETAGELFYKRLFELKPEYRKLFPEDMRGQRLKLLKMLAFIVRSLDFPETAWKDDVPEDEDLMLVVLALGRRHSDLYKIPNESYATVGEALIWTLDYGLGEAFTPQVKATWLKVYGLLVTTMKLGSSAMVSELPQSLKDTPMRVGEQAIFEAQAALGILETPIAVGGNP